MAVDHVPLARAVVTSSRARRVNVTAFVLVALGYVAWASRFIAASAIETRYGRRFCLFDDAMVSLRYAWNLAHGDGLVWNPGEHVEGVTSFLFTLAMAPAATFLDKSSSALFVQVSAIPIVLAIALLATRLLRALDAPDWLGLAGAIAVLAYYPLSYWSLMGMETGLLTALTLGALAIALRGPPDSRSSKRLGLLLGLMVATRPDAALPVVAILGHRAALALRARPRRLRSLSPLLIDAGACAAIIFGLTLFRWLYFGALVPNTYDLKIGGWPLLSRLANGWKFVVPFLDAHRYLLLLALGPSLLRWSGRRVLLLGVVASLIAGQIWVGGDAWPAWRLLVPAAILLIVLAVDGSLAVTRALFGPKRPALTAFTCIAAPALALWLADRPFFDEQRLQVPAFGVALNRSTVEAGLELAQYADPGASVAVAAAGAVPYYSGLRGIDVLGKSDRTIARRRPHPGIGSDTVTPGHTKFDLAYSIVQLKPDAIYDALAWARHEPGIFEFVQSRYVQRGSFWLRRDSPHVHWDDSHRPVPGTVGG